MCSGRFSIFDAGSLLASVVLALGAMLVFGLRRDSDNFEKVNLRLIPPPPHVELFSFGYRDSMADIFWLRVLQDIHICENAKSGMAHQAGQLPQDEPMCRLGWVFKMTDTITTLAPNWKLPYSVGALMLSVVVDDREGATQIFEKGIAKFPTDYNLLYNASYHYIWEEKKPERAAELLLTAAQNGGPGWFYSLAGKLYSQSGKALMAKAVLEDALKQNLNEQSKKRILARLKEVDGLLEKDHGAQ